MKKIIKVTLLFFVSVVMIGCTPRFYKTTEQVTEGVHSDISHFDNRIGERAPTVIDRKEAYIDARPISLHRQPAWLNKIIQLRGQELPFRFYAEKAIANTGAYIHYQQGLKVDRRIAMDYVGPIRGALDKLAAKSGYGYAIDGNTVSWSAFVTRTFDVSFMPGMTSYQVGRNQSATDISNPSATGSYAEDKNSEYSNITGELSIWHDLEKTLNKLKSKSGKIDVSEATTSVTVQDYPENVAAIAHYIQSMNRNLSREVMIQVQVLEVQLGKGFSYGIDWNLIAGQFKLAGDLASPIKLTPVGGTDATMDIGYGIIRNPFGSEAGVKILLKALAEQGTLSTQTYPRVITMNNQVAQIGINTQTSYLAQTSTTSTEQNSTTALTPGVINEGFTLYLLPKIQGGNVYLQISSTLAHLVHLGEKNFKDGHGNTTSSIQLPVVSYKRFNQRSVVPNGSTLVLAGFKQITNEANKNAMLGIWAAGGKGAKQVDTETLVLITPTIVGN